MSFAIVKHGTECGDKPKAFSFIHKECEFFPCHATDDPDGFNCLFCYCPLYTLGERCGGNFTYTAKGIKNCMNCAIPHHKDSAEYIISRFDEIADLARKNAN